MEFKDRFNVTVEPGEPDAEDKLSVTACAEALQEPRIATTSKENGSIRTAYLFVIGIRTAGIQVLGQDQEYEHSGQQQIAGYTYLE
jgi:hypothetical protein